MFIRPTLRLTLISTLLMVCSGCTHFAQDSWTGKDKAQHFVGSAVLAAAGTAYADRQNMSSARSRSFGLLFAISLGAGKELWDSRQGGTGWSWKDFAWDVAGAATGYGLYQAAK